MEKKYFKIYKNNFLLIFLFILTIFNTNYLSISETYIFGGNDGFAYYQIAKSSPLFAEGLQDHKAWRFFFPYLFGIFSKLLNIDVFLIFRIASFFICIHSIILLKNLFNKGDKNLIFILISSIILNPYFIKYYLALPLLINDLIFIYSTILISFIFKDKKKFYLGLIVACLSRQESLVILLGLIILNFFFLKRKFFNYREYLFILSIYILIYYLNFFYASNSSSILAGYDLKVRFSIFFEEIDTVRLIKFLLLPSIPLAFLGLFFLVEFKNIKKNITIIITNEKLFFSIIISIGLIALPILGGTGTSGRNLMRLSNFSIIFISYFFFLLHNQTKIKEKKTLLFIIFLIFFSLHPTYSNFSIYN